MSTPLEHNIARLVAKAPPRERLSAEARARISAALETAWSSGRVRPAAQPDADDRGSDVARPRIPRVAVAAALAAAVLGMVLGVRALLDQPGTGGEADRSLASVDAPDGVSRPGDQGANDPPGPGGPDESVPGLPVAGSVGRTTPGSTDPNLPPGATSGAGSAPGSASDPGALDVRATLALDEGVVAIPETVTIWVRPIVPLPRVADVTAHQLPWAGEGRTLDVSLDGALAPARAYGATHVRVQAEAPGTAPSWRRMALSDLDGAPLALTLGPGRALSGFVVDEGTGAPLDGALVVAVDQMPLDALAIHPTANEPIPDPSATSDANGAFRLEHVAATDTVLLRASRPGYAPSWARAEPGASGLEPVTLALGPGGTVSGIVERDDGTRWSGATVIVSRQETDPGDHDRPVMTYGRAKTAADGTYTVGNVPPGTYVVLNFGQPETATAGPLAFRKVEIQGVETARVDFLAPQGGAGISFAGVLRAADGTAIGGASLTLMRLEGSATDEGDWRATQSSSDGKFAFTDLPAAPYALYTASDGFRHMHAIWTGNIEGPLEREVRLPETGIEVRCTRARDGAPAPSAWVILEAWDEARKDWIFAGRGPASEVEDDAAVARFIGVPIGRYRASVLGASRGLGSVAIAAFDVTPGPERVLDVDIPAGGPLEVRAVDARGGEPLAGLTVRVVDATGAAVPQQETRLTGADGVVRVADVPHGSVTVEFRRAGTLVHRQEFAFEDDAEPLMAAIELDG